MPREAGQIFVGVVVAEVVEQEERIEFLRVAEPEAALQLHAGAFEGGPRRQDLLDGSYGQVATSDVIADPSIYFRP